MAVVVEESSLLLFIMFVLLILLMHMVLEIFLLLFLLRDEIFASCCCGGKNNTTTEERTALLCHCLRISVLLMYEYVRKVKGSRTGVLFVQENDFRTLRFVGGGAWRSVGVRDRGV